MGRCIGLTDAVMSAMSFALWRTRAEVFASIDQDHHDSAASILSEKRAKGFVLRRGKYPRFEYRLNPDPPPLGKPGRKTGWKLWLPAPTPIPAHAVMPSPEQHTPPASLGTVCRVPTPQNRAQGRIEDAVAAVLDRTITHSLNEVLAVMPVGWSRAEVIGALADGVIEGWVGTGQARGRQFYTLRKPPPTVRVDPLAEKFKAIKLRERCQALDTDLTDALRDAREFDAPTELVHALVELRRCAHRTALALGH